MGGGGASGHQQYGQQYGPWNGGGWDGTMTEDERRLWGVDQQWGVGQQQSLPYRGEPGGTLMSTTGFGADAIGGGLGGGEELNGASAGMSDRGLRALEAAGGHPALPDELTFSPTSSPTGAFAHSGHRPQPHFS